MFRDNTCGSCHAFAAAGATGTTGPSLDTKRFSVEAVKRVVRSGAEGMPSYENRVNDAELAALARFVVTRSRAR